MENMLRKLMDEIEGSTKAVRVLPCEDAAKDALKKAYSINSKSLLAVLLEQTGGMVIDNWIRFYGAGEINFVFRNKLFPFDEIVIAEDILGGLFLCLKNGSIGYFAPDCLELEDMEISLGQFLYWGLHGDTDTFYQDYRWEGWQKDVSKLKYSEGMAFYPFLWVDVENLESRSRKAVPIDEIIRLEFDFLEQMQGR